jgi:hypothetical protein
VSVRITAPTPIGTLTKKIHSQPMPEVITPPTTGPTATAAPITPPNTPNAMPRSFPWKALAISASEVANIIAPPIPCTARARFSASGVDDSPQTAEATVNTTRPVTNTRRRPTRSANAPAVSRNAARVSEYALTTHCRSLKLECSERWISGSATFTTVMSSSSMKIATETAIRVHHLRSIVAPRRRLHAGFSPATI